MFPLSLSIVVTTLISLSCCIRSQEQKPLHEVDHSPFSSDFDKYVERLMHNWHVPGLAIAVVDGNVTYSKVYIG